MHDALATVLGRLELDPPHFMGHEVGYWPKDALGVWTDWGVLRPISPSTSLPCHGCGGDYYGEVVYVNSLRTKGRGKNNFNCLGIGCKLSGWIGLLARYTV